MTCVGGDDADAVAPVDVDTDDDVDEGAGDLSAPTTAAGSVLTASGVVAVGSGRDLRLGDAAPLFGLVGTSVTATLVSTLTSYMCMCVCVCVVWGC